MPTNTRLRAHACALTTALVIATAAAIWLHPLTALLLVSCLLAACAAAAELWSRVHELQHQLARASATDAPTGVLTTSAFRAARECSAFATVVTVQLDDIDGIARTYGRAVADAVLGHVANVICASVRENDPVGKTGDAEFGILLGDVEHDVAQRICNRIEARIASTPYSSERAIIELYAEACIGQPPEERRAA